MNGTCDNLKLFDHGYVNLVEAWGSDESIIEAARMSTGGGFKGWGKRCVDCGGDGFIGEHLGEHECPTCKGKGQSVGDEKLLKYLWDNKHSTPFEMAGATFEIQAPIFVFREWHRHRTQCLHPDTLIHFDSPKSVGNRKFVYKLRIEDIWKKWQPTVRHNRPERQTNALFPRSRIQAMHLRYLIEDDDEFSNTSIVDVIRGDPKPMVRIVTTSGREIALTLEHRVYTYEGWMTVKEALDCGAALALEGVSRGKAMRWEVPCIDETTEFWKPCFGWDDLYEISDQGRVRRIGCEPKKICIGSNGYNTVNLSSEGVTVARTVHRLVLETFVGACPKGHEARHLNDNRADARLSNLVWGTPKENAGDRVRGDRQQRLVPVFEEITSVEKIGEWPTYDLSVAGPTHNFVADGFVVHNSYSEASARYGPIPNFNYIPALERLFLKNKINKQAGAINGADELTEDAAKNFLVDARGLYERAEGIYKEALQAGVPKELARIVLPVGRYSKMRASANLRNWLGFLTLRLDEAAQHEIRMYACAVESILMDQFPRTMELFRGDPDE